MKVQGQKLITAIVPVGKAMPVIARLKDEKGIIAANVHRARGVGKISLGTKRGFGEEQEKSVLSVMVSTERLDEIFEFIFFEAEINHPHGGIVYVSAVHAASFYELPDVPDED